jgi:hypothetical protein
LLRLRWEEKLGLRSIPEFLKHADWYPHAVLKEHSAETAHITFALAIRLWKDNVGAETEPMRAFGLRKKPYEPEKLLHAATDVIAGGREIGDIAEITLGSTDSGLERGPRRK